MKGRKEAGLTEIQWQKVHRYARAHPNYSGWIPSNKTDEVWACEDGEWVEIYPDHAPDPKWNKSLKEKIY